MEEKHAAAVKCIKSYVHSLPLSCFSRNNVSTVNLHHFARLNGNSFSAILILRFQQSYVHKISNSSHIKSFNKTYPNL